MGSGRRPAKETDMATSQMSEVISHLRRTVLLREGVGLTDGQLLEDYLSRREEAALEALVWRHAPMVWGVCRRVLGNHHDAEDAFQATFLILVRKAASIASPTLLANWLYGVAHQTALKARATAAKRRARERQVTPMPEPAATEPDLWNDLQPLLDQELSRLPDKYRVAIVLCDLEGKTRKEAARQLGVPDGTLAARLARGRVMLAKRLARHGLAVSGGALGAMLSQNVASTGVPSLVVSSTIKAASLFAAGQTAAVGLISAKVAALTEGVLQTMLLSKIKFATAVVLVVAAVVVGGNRLLIPTRAAAGADGPKQGPPKKHQPPREDKPQIEVMERDGAVERHVVLFVRDPSSGEFKPLAREDGIPVLKGHIELQVKKLKEAKDDKSIRQALKSLEESVQNMKDLLSLPGRPAEKKPEDKKPGKEKPALKSGAGVERDKETEPPQILVCFADSGKDRPSVRFITATRKELAWTDISSSEMKANRRWREPPPASVQGAPIPVTIADLKREELRGHRRLGRIVTREEAIPIIQNYIELDLKKLKEAKDDQSMRETLGRLEHSVQMMKELLTFDPSRKKS
jgi:RNA polymerase sigma factor (sigma-70 family)